MTYYTVFVFFLSFNISETKHKQNLATDTTKVVKKNIFASRRPLHIVYKTTGKKTRLSVRTYYSITAAYLLYYRADILNNITEPESMLNNIVDWILETGQ